VKKKLFNKKSAKVTPPTFILPRDAGRKEEGEIWPQSTQKRCRGDRLVAL
jgi:hypothetical protein